MSIARVSAVLAAALAFVGCGPADEGAVAGSSPTSAGPSGSVDAPAATTATSGPPPTTSSPPPASSSVPTSQTRPASTAPATTVPAPSTLPPLECVRVHDFDDPAGWFIVNDGVMGGRSDGRGVVEDSVLSFTGSVVTAGGGFTSVRLRLDGDELDGSDRVLVRLRADDRTYGLTLEDDQTIQGRRISHGADLPATVDVDDDGFGVVEMTYDRLEPTIFGTSVSAEPFRPDVASEIGIIIGDGVDGDFALQVDWIDACR